MKPKLIRTLSDLLDSISWDSITGSFVVYDYALDNFIKVYRPLEVKFISNFFSKKRIENLVPGNAYIINSPTATGKNHLVKTKLYMEAIRCKKRILYVSGRKALVNQVKYHIDKICNAGIKGNYTPKGLDTVHSIGIVDIYLLQELYFNSKNREELMEKLPEYRFIIIDEFHQYVTDASFNPYTEEVFDFLTSEENFPNASRIYMSATPDYALDAVLEQEVCNRSYWSKPAPVLPPAKSTNLWAPFGPEYYNCVFAGQEVTFYQFTKSYSYIKPVFFTTYDQMEAALNSIEMSRKTLVFTPTKDYGKHLLTKFGDKAAYIDSESKNSEGSEQFEKLIDNHSFDTLYLIVTNFLDVGVDLIDIKLNNIVIYSPYAHEILQMLGRKRAMPGETLNVYIYIPTYEDIVTMCSNLIKDRADMLRAKSFYQSHADYNIDEIPEHFWLKRDRTNTSLEFNNFAVINAEKRIAELSEYLTEFNGSGAEYYRHYSNHILDMLPDHQIVRWLGDETFVSSDIAEKIKPFIGRVLSRDEAYKFCHIVLDHFGKKLRPNQMNGIPTSTVNKIFSGNGINLKIANIKGKTQLWEVK